MDYACNCFNTRSNIYAIIFNGKEKNHIMNSLINIFNFTAALNATNSELLKSFRLLLTIIVVIGILIIIFKADKTREISDYNAFLITIFSIILGIFVYGLINVFIAVFTGDFTGLFIAILLIVGLFLIPTDL